MGGTGHRPGLSSRKGVYGYADNRYTSARDMAEDIVHSYEKNVGFVSFGEILTFRAPKEVSASHAPGTDRDAVQNSADKN